MALIAVAGCSKNNDSIKAVPKATDNGSFQIILDASGSTGPVATWGWQLDISTQTQSAVTYSPGSNSNTGNYFPVTATVSKAGNYTFGLTVYDKENHKDYQKITVEVK